MLPNVTGERIRHSLSIEFDCVKKINQRFVVVIVVVLSLPLNHAECVASVRTPKRFYSVISDSIASTILVSFYFSCFDVVLVSLWVSSFVAAAAAANFIYCWRRQRHSTRIEFILSLLSRFYCIYANCYCASSESHRQRPYLNCIFISVLNETKGKKWTQNEEEKRTHVENGNDDDIWADDHRVILLARVHSLRVLLVVWLWLLFCVSFQFFFLSSFLFHRWSVNKTK